MMRAVLILFLLAAPAFAAEPPNVVLIVADDLGYGDLGCYGSPTIRTPNLDKLAASGLKLRSCYSSSPLCTPSRAGLLTGRQPRRVGMQQTTDTSRGVLFPNSAGGLPATERTLAKLLKDNGYATRMVGKWHLGWYAETARPTAHGFDGFYGIPYSHNMNASTNPETGETIYDVPLIWDTTEIERPVVQATLTERLTDDAVTFIGTPKAKPFFLQVSYHGPHIPCVSGSAFTGQSPRGPYGDMVEELDYSVGRIVQALKDERLTENTIVIFTSDNGPWLEQLDKGGSAGVLRNGKASTWEGGVRVPGIINWPGVVPARTSDGLLSHLDILPTVAALANVTVPADRTYDGIDQSAFLKGGESTRAAVYLWRGPKLYAVRSGDWKAHFYTRSAYGPDAPALRSPPWLFHLGVDPSEKMQLEASHPATITAITDLANAQKAAMTAGAPQLDSLIPPP